MRSNPAKSRRSIASPSIRSVSRTQPRSSRVTNVQALPDSSDRPVRPISIETDGDRLTYRLTDDRSLELTFTRDGDGLLLNAKLEGFGRAPRRNDLLLAHLAL